MRVSFRRVPLPVVDDGSVPNMRPGNPRRAGAEDWGRSAGLGAFGSGHLLGAHNSHAGCRMFTPWARRHARRGESHAVGEGRPRYGGMRSATKTMRTFPAWRCSATVSQNASASAPSPRWDPRNGGRVGSRLFALRLERRLNRGDRPVSSAVCGVVEHLTDHLAPDLCIARPFHLNEGRNAFLVNKEMVEAPPSGAAFLFGTPTSRDTSSQRRGTCVFICPSARRSGCSARSRCSRSSET